MTHEDKHNEADGATIDLTGMYSDALKTAGGAAAASAALAALARHRALVTPGIPRSQLDLGFATAPQLLGGLAETLHTVRGLTAAVMPQPPRFDVPTPTEVMRHTTLGVALAAGIDNRRMLEHLAGGRNWTDERLQTAMQFRTGMARWLTSRCPASTCRPTPTWSPAPPRW